MENMKIVLMNGGMGNQLYQYAFMRILEVATKEKCIIDDSAFWGSNVEHDGFALENAFGLRLNLLSRHFTPDVWQEMLRIRDTGVSIPQQLLNNGINLTIMAEFSDYGSFDGNVVNMPPNAVSTEVLQTYISTKGKFYYHGYWVRAELVNSIRKYLLQELTFIPLELVPKVPLVYREYLREIKETNSIAVHIRRGDFIQLKRVQSVDKYARSIAYMENKYAGYNYFVFSDDADWCKEHAEELGLTRVAGKVVYVTGQISAGYDYVDMQLMSQCKQMIISNSSFGCWAYYLNQNSNVEAVFADNI